MSCESVFTVSQKPTTISDRLILDTLSSIVFFSPFTDTQTTCNFKKENATFLPPLSHIPILAKIIVIPLFKLLDCRKPKNKPHYLVKRSELIFDKDIYICRNSLSVSDFYQLNSSLFILLDLLINQLEMLGCMTQQRFITGMN